MSFQVYQGGPPAPPPPIRQQSPIQLKTTRDANGAMTTETPVSGYGGDDFGIAIAEILRNRMQQPQAPPPQQYAPPPPPREEGARIEQIAPRPRAPEMGSAPVQRKPERVTRMRKLSGTQDPFAVDAWAGSKQLNPGTMVQEYQLPDGSWSLDAVHGTLEGNEQAARAHQQAVYRSPVRGADNMEGESERMQESFRNSMGSSPLPPRNGRR